MALAWNEIRKKAIEFSKEWENETREDAEAKTFWDGFFNVFGISRRRIASFEEPVNKLGEKKGYIDLFWKGTLIVESKSRGKSLDKAYEQALDYFPGLKEVDLPKYVIVTDFERMRLYDLETKETFEFLVSKLYENIKLFSFIAGYSKTNFKSEDPVNIDAAELMGKLHDTLLASGYTGHQLEVFLVRILFCLFSDDTGIFEKGIFADFIRNRTKEDGSDLGGQLAFLFQILNTPEDRRFSSLDDDLKRFPYINGKLYEESIALTAFDSSMRDALLKCCNFDWSRISPAIFGSLFQSVMNKDLRRNLGAHYTSESNILKLIRPLFLDGLYEEFNKVKTNRRKLEEFHNNIAKLKFFDPACGCGNFLVVTYRELRLLEIEIIKLLNKERQTSFDITLQIKLDVDSFYGIEIGEFPARIAEVALWLVDHQMNMRVSEEMGFYYARLPLKKAANIIVGNALRLNWEDILPMNEMAYILGNPPFIGKQLQNSEQKQDIDVIFKGVKGAGVLDYVTCWYIKAAQYIQNTKIKVAFVSTNSISQGEQVGILWKELFEKYGIKIHFAHRTFSWTNEARGKAAVHVVIIGFGNFDVPNKSIFEYENIKGEPHEVKVKNINPYIVEGNDLIILSRNKPISNVPKIVFGSMPNEGGHLLLSNEEKVELLRLYPDAGYLIKPFKGSYEFINGINRWCLWLVNVLPLEIKKFEEVYKRIEKVKEYRLASKREATRKLASIPYLFGEIRQPQGSFLIIPKVSSERRKYVPIGYVDKEMIISDLCLMIPNATLYHFGVLTSEMHMAWIKYVCGKLKSDFRYSNNLVYNNFLWPENSTKSQMNAVEKAAQNVLDIRKEFPNSTLADLYDPLTMPPKLVKSHQELDRAVDKCYRSKPFKDDKERIEFLFDMYQKLVAKG